MNARKRRRMAFVTALLLGGAGAAALVVGALKDNVLYFYSPSDVYAKHVSPGVAFRIGGLSKSTASIKVPGPRSVSRSPTGARACRSIFG